MGKSKMEILPTEELKLKMPQKVVDMGLCMPEVVNIQGQNGIYDNNSTIDMVQFPNQVSGHMNDGKHIGLISHNGKLLKPIGKPKCFERETMFYESMETTEDDIMLELKKHIPRYFGNTTISVENQKINCIIMEDLTKDMKEPCIMDVKIGRRTWDPQASYEKIMKEEHKYQLTKRELGFCITGFQVYKISNGKLIKYGKDYGKKLTKETVPEAFKTFLNADTSMSRPLLVQLLACLWRIQNWARKQRKVRLYSSSILIMYDARKLKQALGEVQVQPKPSKTLTRSNSLYRPLSLAVLNGNDKDKIPTGFSGQLSQEGPILKSPTSPRIMEIPATVPEIDKKERKRSTTTVPTLKRVHSFHNNYDKDLQTMKRDYTYMLDDLVSDQKNDLWVSVKIIDFAHAFPANNNKVDTNYLEGIENLVKIFEDFLTLTDYHP